MSEECNTVNIAVPGRIHMFPWSPQTKLGGQAGVEDPSYKSAKDFIEEVNSIVEREGVAVVAIGGYSPATFNGPEVKKVSELDENLRAVIANLPEGTILVGADPSDALHYNFGDILDGTEAHNAAINNTVIERISTILSTGLAISSTAFLVASARIGYRIFRDRPVQNSVEDQPTAEAAQSEQGINTGMSRREFLKLSGITAGLAVGIPTGVFALKEHLTLAETEAANQRVLADWYTAQKAIENCQIENGPSEIPGIDARTLAILMKLNYLAHGNQPQEGQAAFNYMALLPTMHFHKDSRDALEALLKDEEACLKYLDETLIGYNNYIDQLEFGEDGQTLTPADKEQIKTLAYKSVVHMSLAVKSGEFLVGLPFGDPKNQEYIWKVLEEKLMRFRQSRMEA